MQNIFSDILSFLEQFLHIFLPQQEQRSMQSLQVSLPQTLQFLIKQLLQNLRLQQEQKPIQSLQEICPEEHKIMSFIDLWQDSHKTLFHFFLRGL